MDDQHQENLKELFATFFDAEQAESYVEEFCQAEQVFSKYPTPEPDEMLIANIKAEVAISLGSRRAICFKRRLYEAAGIAAAIVILTIVSVQLFDRSDIPSSNSVSTASLLPTAIWESDDIAVDDVDLVVFTAEIEQIENEVLILQSGEEPSENESTITELEMELEEINSDFWKG